MAQEQRAVAASVEVSASVSKLWACWTTPEGLNAWYTVASSGEPAPGSSFVWQFDHFFGPPQVVHVDEVRPGVAIAFRTGGMRIRVELTPSGGGTRVELVHSGFPADSESGPLYQGCRSGWQMSLGQLKFYLENYDGQQRRELLLLEPCAEDLAGLFRDAKARRRWLTLDDPPREVLVDTGSEVLMRWDAVGGTLELKQFEWGGTRYGCLRSSSWARDYDLAYRRPALAEAIANLRRLAVNP